MRGEITEIREPLRSGVQYVTLRVAAGLPITYATWHEVPDLRVGLWVRFSVVDPNTRLYDVPTLHSLYPTAIIHEVLQ